MSDVDRVRVHLHHTMTGRYPLRLLDLLFYPDRVLAVEYDYLTGFDIATGGGKRRAEAFAATVTEKGVAATLDTAERCQELPYETLEAIRIYDGGSLGRVKVVLDRATGSSLTVRVHGEVDVDSFAGAVRTVLAPYDATVEREAGLGLRDALPDLSRR